MILAPPKIDPSWPAPLALLMGRDAGELLQTALDGFGGTLRMLRVVSVAVQPSGATVVQYAADVEHADGAATREILAATTGARIPRGAAVLEGDVGGETVRVGLWRWPHDPALPALAVAADPQRLRGALAAVGLERSATPRARVRAYRPGRRAVLEVTGGGERLFCKVVRPTAVAALRARHDLIAPVAPVPPVLAATDDGLVVLPAAAGTPVRALLAQAGAADPTPGAGAPTPDTATPDPAVGKPASLPGGPSMDALLDRLPAELTGLSTRRAPLDRVEHFAAVLSLTSFTGEPDRLAELVGRLAGAERGEHPRVPVHGDFYEAQLLAEDGVVTGLLDVDTAGGGARIDEWATLLAHLSVLGGRAKRWGAELLAHAEGSPARPGYDRAQLRPRIAAAVLGLATGSFRVQQAGWATHTARRVALAEQWRRF